MRSRLAASCWLGTESLTFAQIKLRQFPIVETEPNVENPAPTEGSPLDVDRRLKQILAEAEEDLAQGKTAQALERFQFALGRAKNMLTTREDWNVKISDREYVIYRSITGEIERRLAKLPPADLGLYRQTYDPDAQLLLNNNGDEGGALEDLVQQYFLSTYGDESAYHLALLWFDQGDYARSARMLQKIVADYPDSNVSPKQLRLRLALTSAHMRDVASAQKYWAEYQELAGGEIPEAVRLIYGQELANASKTPAQNGTSSESRGMQFGSPAPTRTCRCYRPAPSTNGFPKTGSCPLRRSFSKRYPTATKIPKRWCSPVGKSCQSSAPLRA